MFISPMSALKRITDSTRTSRHVRFCQIRKSSLDSDTPAPLIDDNVIDAMTIVVTCEFIVLRRPGCGFPGKPRSAIVHAMFHAHIKNFYLKSQN